MKSKSISREMWWLYRVVFGIPLNSHKHSHVLRCSSASVVKNFPSRVVLIGATKSERISGSLAKTILTALTKASKNRERETGLREFMAMVDKLQAQKSNAEHSIFTEEVKHIPPWDRSTDS